MKKFLLEKLNNSPLSFTSTKKLYLALVLSILSFTVHAQCIGPYQTFESFKTMSAGWTLNSGATSFTSTASGFSRSGANLLQQSSNNSTVNVVTLNYPAVISPAFTNSKTVAFYVQRNAGAGIAIPYDFQYSPDNGANWYTIPNGTNTVNGESITATIPTPATTAGATGWNLVTATFNTNHLLDLPLPTNTSFKFRIRDVRSSGTNGTLWLDDFSVITYNSPSDNLTLVPELGASVSCNPVTIPAATAYRFYDQGGVNDTYSKSQTETTYFKPAVGTDKVRITFNALSLEITTKITISNWDGTTLTPLLTNFSGTSLPAPAIFNSTNPGDMLVVTFVTSATAAGASNFGYDLTVECPGSLAITSLGTAAGCQGASLAINGSGFVGTTAVSVGGTPVTSFTVTSANLITAVPAPGSTGTVTVTNGTSVTSAATYTVRSLPTATAGSSGSTCAGNSLSLTGGASGGSGSGYSYLWSGPSAYSNATQSPVVSAAATTGMSGTYTLTVTDGNSCTNTTTTAVTISAGPTTSTNTGNQSACKGSLSPALGGNTPGVGTGAWSCTAAPGGGSTSDITFTSVTTGNTTAIVAAGAVAGNYTLTWTISSAGCTSSASSLTLTVNTPSTFTATSLSSQTICQSAAATALSVTASGTISTYQWYSNPLAVASGGTAVGTNSNTYTPVTTVVGTLYYYCVVTNSSGCTTTSTISGGIVVTATPAPPTASGSTSIGGSSFLANWGAVSGATGYFLDVSTSNSFASYVSGYNNLSVGNVTSYSVTGLTQGTIYYYRVRAANSCGTSGNSGNPSATTLTLNYAGCVPTYSSGDSLGDQITNVTLGTLNNSSGVSASPYYTYYNAVTVPTIYQGGTATISVTFGTDSRQYLGVWIDFNQNGTFETSEGFVTTNSAGGGGTANLTITVPVGALLGNTRMRVRGGDDSALTTSMPCGATNSVFGETEDYIVNIITVPPCAPNLPSALTASFITATTAVLSWTDATMTPNSAYEFAINETGTTPPSGTFLYAATTTNLTGLVLGHTYYCWVRANCGGSNQSAWVGPISFTTVSLDVVNLDSSTTGQSISTCNAKFYDSGSATGNYANSESYTYTFSPASAGSKLKAVFNSFAVESGYDYLSVYSGTTVSAANLLGTYTGTQITAGQTFYSTAAGGELTFRFTSDGSVTYSGWDVSLTCVTMPSISSFTPTTACAGATPSVIITGTNLLNVNAVTFNGIAATPTATTATTVTVALPATATTGFITVSTPTATATSTTQFIVKPLPATPNAGSDVAVCLGSSTTLNATGSVASQVIAQNACNTLASWTTNDSTRWLVSSTSNAGGTTGELDFHWNPSGVTDSSIYLNQIMNTTGYTGLNLSFKNTINWFASNFNLSVETSPDLVTWTSRWSVVPTANVAASTVNVNLSALNGTSFYIRFRFNGNSYNIDDWFIDNVTLSGVPALTYSWAANGTLSSTTINNPVATPTSTQTYTVTTTLNSCSSLVGDDVIVTVNPRPTSILTGTQAICNATTASLSVALTGTAPWTITYTNGVTPVTVSGIMTSPYIITTPSISSTTTYTVTAVSDSKCSAPAGDMTGSASITISTAPTITVGTAADVCYSNSSQTTTLNYTATTGTIATYSIFWNSTPYLNYATVTDAPFTGSPLSVTVPGSLNNGINNAYIVVKNSNGCVSANTAFTVTILPSPTVTISSSIQTVCYNASSSQTATYPYSGASTLNNYDVTWNASPANSLSTISNASFTVAAGNITITVPAGTPGGTYTGTVTPRNASCGAGAAPRTIFLIVSAPSITPAASATAVCFSAGAQTTPLTYSAVTGTTYSIAWNASPANSFAAVTNAAVVSSPISIAVPAGTVANTYTGTITVTNAGCVSAGVPFTVKVSGKPVMASPFVLEPVCPNSSAQTAVLIYTTVTNVPTSYSIDWNAAANTAGLADQGVTAYTFIASDGDISSIVVPANLPANQYSGTLTITNATGCSNAYPITMYLGKTWKGITSTDWATASNWVPAGEPTASDYCVTVPSGTPFSPVISADAYCGDLTVNTGATLTVNSGVAVEVQDFVKTDGTLTMNNNSSLVQINDVPNSGTGSMVYKRDVNALNGYDYVYWSSPVASQSLNGLYAVPTMGNKYYWDTLFDNGNGSAGNISQGTWAVASGTMNVGKGYIIRGSTSYAWSGNLTSTFTGIPNTGTLSVPVARGSFQGSIAYPGINGMTITNLDDNMNLIGNPYPSAVRAQDFLNFTSNTPVIRGFIYLWTHSTSPATTANPFYGSYETNYFTSDYLTYNSAGSSSGPGSFNGYIASGQGFFVTMNDGPADSTQSVTFTNDMRSQSYANNQFYKTAAMTAVENDKHRIWLDLVDSSLHSTRALIGYVAGATLGKDRNYDAYTKVDASNIIYSLIDGESQVIQGRPLPFDSNDQVPLGFHAAAAGNYTIAIGAVDGLFLEGQAVYLEDKLLDVIYDLRQAPYVFSSEQGTFDNRFVLRYTNGALSSNQFNLGATAAALISNKQLQIKATEAIASVQVYDVSGKLIKTYSPSIKSDELKEEFPFERGVYFAKIKLENGGLVTQKLMN